MWAHVCAACMIGKTFEQTVELFDIFDIFDKIANSLSRCFIEASNEVHMDMAVNMPLMHANFLFIPAFCGDFDEVLSAHI